MKNMQGYIECKWKHINRENLNLSIKNRLISLGEGGYIRCFY